MQDPSFEITDQNLTLFVQEVKQTDSRCGIHMMHGRLQSKGYVRSDQGLENISVAQRMIEKRDAERHSMITYTIINTYKYIL